MNWLLDVQARPDVGPLISQTVLNTVSKVHDPTALAVEIEALLKYVEHTLVMREVKKQRKQWEEDRQAKVSEAIARAMKGWDDEHYPRLLQATWGWHPFYSSFVANPACVDFTPPYPLHHSLVEGGDVNSLLLEQCYVHRVYPVPWSALLLRCFLKYHRAGAPFVSHPDTGATPANVAEWARLATEVEGDGLSAWKLGATYLKEEGFYLFAGARPVDSRDQWVDEVKDAIRDLLSGTPEWWEELQVWCNSTRLRAVRDMAFHDREMWLKAWVIKDRPPGTSTPLACYNRWLQYREDLDIGYILAEPGKLRVAVICYTLLVFGHLFQSE